MFFKLNSEEMMAKLSPRRRAAIKRAVACESAKIEAMLVAREVKAKTASAGASMSASHEELMAGLPQKLRETVKKKAAEEIARLRADAAQGKSSSVSSGGVQSAGMPMAATTVGN